MMATEEVLDIAEMDLECLGTVGIYAKKYFALRKKCEQIQQSNEKLVNRLYHVKRMIKKYKKEKRLFMGKLEEHSDNFREAEVQPLWEELPSTSAPNPPAAAEEATTTPLSVETTSSQALTVSSVPHESSSTSPGASTKVKKSRVEKVEKDVNAPKKPANAFLKFCQHQRPLIQEQYRKEENDEISHPELTRRLATQWNALPPEKKNVYYDLYEQEKEKYEQELEAYTGGKQAAGVKPPPENPPIAVLTAIKTEPL